MQKLGMVEKTKLNQDAWDILSEDEKAAVSLSLGHGKSSWEAGEILNRAHFKYLEIQKRARKFIEIFTNHFEKYYGLFPEGLHLSFAFKEYLTLTIIERKHISLAIKQMEETSFNIASRRTKLIVKEITRLKNDPTEKGMDMYNLIMDFDRWNNFRILPLEVQEPSAFKRRNKARNVKHLKKLISLPQYSVFKIIQKYSYTGKYPKLYVPIMSRFLEDKYHVIPIKNKSTLISDLTKIGLFIFEHQATADKFGRLVSEYFVDNAKNCKTGQKFWPDFRVMMSEAINYGELENIHKSRTYLDWAIFDKDKMKKRKYRSPTGGEKRIDGNQLYPG